MRMEYWNKDRSTDNNIVKFLNISIISDTEVVTGLMAKISKILLLVTRGSRLRIRR